MAFVSARALPLTLWGFLALSGSLVARADTPVSVQDECSQLIQERASIQAGRAKSHVGLTTLLKLLFDKGALVSPVSVKQAPGSGTPQAMPLSTSLAASGITLFTLGDLGPLTDADQNLLKKFRNEEARQLKIASELLKSKDAQDCVARAGALDWTPAQLDSLDQLQTSALPATRKLEAQDSRKAARGVLRSHPGWKMLEVNSWSEILSELRSVPTRGAIVIAHSSPAGRLFDSQRDELPTGFFAALPAAVGFVGVFSCDSSEVIKAYSLDQLGPDREVVVVEMSAPFSSSESTPVQLFGAWTQKAQKDGLLRTNGPAPVSDPAEFSCEAELRGLSLAQGRVSLTIGGLPVGVWSEGAEAASLRFPCAWIADRSAIFADVEPTQLGEQVVFTTADFEVVLHDGNQELTAANRRSFQDSSGLFRSALFSGFSPR